MKNYFKKFSLIFVMSLLLMLGCVTSAFADDATYTNNLIPKMTSNTSPSGVASASASYSDSYAPYRAFNKLLYANGDYYWQEPSTSFPQWISYKFDTPKKICKYTITYIAWADTTRAPRNWIFQGSNDGMTWINLDSQSGISFSYGEKKNFTFENTANYSTYRIYITASNGTATAIDEIEMMEKVQNNATSISLDKSIIDLTEGNSQQLTTTTTPSAVGVTWKSSDESVAIVDNTGNITAVKEGQATITATTNDGSNLSATCTVNVIAKVTDPTEPEPTESEYIVNTALAKGDNTNNASGSVTIIFHGTAETTLNVVKTADVKEVWVGDSFTYTIVITNTGSKMAKDVVINDSAPNHIKFNVNGIVTTQGGVDSSSTSSNVIINVGDIPALGTVTIKIPATVIP